MDFKWANYKFTYFASMLMDFKVFLGFDENFTIFNIVMKDQLPVKTLNFNNKLLKTNN